MFRVSLGKRLSDCLLISTRGPHKCSVFAAGSREGLRCLRNAATLPNSPSLWPVSESGGPELLGRIPRRDVGGASSFSASPSANPVGQRERGCLRVRTLESAFCVRYEGPLAVPASALALARAIEARRPRAGAGGTEGDRRCGEGARTAPPGAGEGPTAPGRLSSHSADVGRARDGAARRWGGPTDCSRSALLPKLAH
jgi:hypothetical protein